MADNREEPEVLLKEIVKAVRSNRLRADWEFKDHRGRRWILSLKRIGDKAS
ncbi:hypothetical protein PBI_TRISCUIT_10 [Microbacterium phage Triscuit]|nr:hypothetical protein PBI_TRISCUIT_10 [Microbacterium phage Triscuit]